MRTYQVELCIDSADSALQAEKYGADRVELCARLDLDGLTPSEDLIRQARAAAPNVGLFPIIRRAGNFVYSEQETLQMIANIEMAKNCGADGIVSGALLEDGKIDLPTTQRLIEASGNLPFTFHRAFDYCSNPLDGFAQLEKIGVSRLLTSGQARKAVDGLAMIELLVELESSIKIQAGSGVNSQNIPAIWTTGVREFHFTSHKKNENGINVFDHNKAEKAFDILHKL